MSRMAECRSNPFPHVDGLSYYYSRRSPEATNEPDEMARLIDTCQVVHNSWVVVL